jgi:integrase/recombinase XerD
VAGPGAAVPRERLLLPVTSGDMDGVYVAAARGISSALVPCGRQRQRLWPALNRDLNGSVFMNRVSQSITRFGIHRVVTRRYANLASRVVPTLATKRVSPHTIRHTTAVHLLRAGVDINTIRAWLGHVSLDTTHIYAEVDLEMKAKALASVDLSGLKARPERRSLPSLVAFLKAL